MLKCLNIKISKNELKIGLIECNASEDPDRDFVRSYQTNLICPKCHKAHSFQEWKAMLGDRDYNDVIEKTVEKSKEKKYLLI